MKEHLAILNILQKNSKVKARGLCRELAAILSRDTGIEKTSLLRELREQFRGYVCDAYHFDEESCVITWFEVDVGHPTDEIKLRTLDMVCEHLQNYGWYLRVVIFRSMYGVVFKSECDIGDSIPKTFQSTSMLREAA